MVSPELHPASRATRKRSFNGATAMKPWKSCDGNKASSRVRVLQWGHGDEAVEEDFEQWQTAVDLAASMGPRR